MENWKSTIVKSIEGSVGGAVAGYLLRRTRNVVNGIGDKVSLPSNDLELAKEINEKGYAVIPNYWSAEECLIARNEMDRLLREFPQFIRSDNVDSDHRLFGANVNSKTLNRFYQDSRLEGFAKYYMGNKTTNAFTLGARMDFEKGNPGSGGGWHRDSYLDQFKSIMYLSECNAENGPFEYLEGSHRPREIINGLVSLGRKKLYPRFTSEEIVELVKLRGYKWKTFTGEPGTLILVNTAGIHRGKPIESGSRYALTNYFMTLEAHQDPRSFDLFRPVMGIDNPPKKQA